MGVINTGTISKAIWPGINAFFGDSYNELPLQWPHLFNKETSDKSYEEDVALSGFGNHAKKTQGQGISYDSMRQGATTRYNHIVYALGFTVTREMMEDVQYELAFKKAKALGFSCRQTQEIVAANIFNRAFNSSYLGGDGVELCSTAHVNIVGGTWSNELATAADLSEASLEQALINVDGYLDDRGQQIAISGKKLVYPTELQFEAKRILKSTLQNDTANNAMNALGDENLELVKNNYLTDPDAWFVLTNSPDGLKCFMRREPEFEKDNDFDTENFKCKSSFRASWGWSDARRIQGSPGS